MFLYFLIAFYVWLFGEKEFLWHVIGVDRKTRTNVRGKYNTLILKKKIVIFILIDFYILNTYIYIYEKENMLEIIRMMRKVTANHNSKKKKKRKNDRRK